MSSDSKVLFKSFTIPNIWKVLMNFKKILSITDSLDKVKIGLETTGHYSLQHLRLFS